MNNHLISLNNKDEIDHVDSYFECISECCIINGHKEFNRNNHDIN